LDFGRKTIHILAVGVPTLLMPYLLREPLAAFFSGLGFAAYTYYFRRKNKLQNWYQVKENSYEVNFCIMWSFSFLFGWFLDKSFWLGAVPGLFISFGDGVTGIVRNFRYKKRNKSWEGSLAMLIVCIIIGGWKFGWAGIIAAFVATFFEKLEGFDDNISVVVSSLAVLIVFSAFFPNYSTSFFLT